LKVRISLWHSLSVYLIIAYTPLVGLLCDEVTC